MHEQGKAAVRCGLLLFTAPAAGAAAPHTFGPPRAGRARHDAFCALARPALPGAPALTARRETCPLAALRARLPRTRPLCARPPRGPWPISAPPRH